MTTTEVNRMREALRKIADGHYKVCHDPFTLVQDASGKFVAVCYCARCIAISALVADEEPEQE